MIKTGSIICIILFILASFTNLGTLVSEGEDSFEEQDDLRLNINLKAARFDPLFEAPGIPLELTYSQENNYYLVQCKGPIQPEWIRDISNFDAIILGYVPEYTYILYIEPESKKSVEELPFVRWVGVYHPAYKIDQDLLSMHGLVQLNVMVFKMDLNTDLKRFLLVKEQITALGGKILREERDVNIIITEIEARNVLDLAFIPEVEWIDEYSPPKALMDNIRTFTGAESPLHEFGFNGSGIVGEVKDSGLDQDHSEFEGQLLDTDGNVDEDSHGTSTFGIVFAKGVNDRAKGMLPGAQGVFATWGVSRKQSIANLVNNWGGVFQSNSWSSGSMDGTYGSNSRQNDEAVFEYNVSMLYATGNGGDEEAISQEATGKNVIGVGAFNHYNNKIRTDDRHTGSQGNRGPTADGRVKPDVVGPYDSIYTTTSGDRYTSGFGGTSGATPVAAGAVGLIYDMYEENHFGNNPMGVMPHASTVKAILIADAYQYEFSQGDRFAQGWGLIDVGNAYNIGKNHMIDDENNAIQTGETITYSINPITTTPLKISLVWTDVPGTTSSALHLVNDLNLEVIDPNGVTYYGNYGLNVSKWSKSDISAEVDNINNVENVFIEKPNSGEWTIKVSGKNIPRDGNRETIQVDQSFALVVSGVSKYEHDLRVQTLTHPRFVGTDENVQINATIINIGTNNEANIKVEFLVDNLTVNTTVLSSIDIGEITELNFHWIPKEAKEYYISVIVEPLSGEISIWDNRKNSLIEANLIIGKVLVDDGHGTVMNHNSYYYYVETMGPEKYRVFHTREDITTELLAQYDVLITAWPTQAYTLDEVTNIRDFVDSGGGLLVIGEDDSSIYDDLTGYAGIDWGTPFVLLFNGETNEINQHEITKNVSSLYFNSPQSPLSVTTPAEEIAYTYGGVVYNRVSVAAAEFGQGKVVAIADSDCLNNQFILEADNKVFGENIIRWLINERPVSIIDLPENNSKYQITDAIQFDGTSSYDPDGDALNYLWLSNISGELGTSVSFSTTLIPGRHKITLEVRDTGGKIAVAETTLRVLGPPTVAIQSPTGGSLVNGVIKVTGTAFDSDGTIQNVEVQIDGGTLQNATDASTMKDWSTWMISWNTVEGSDGDHIISVRSMDNDGLNSSVSSVKLLVDNTPPSLIEVPDVFSITDTEATIEWETNEPSDGVVEYGIDGSYSNSVNDNDFVTHHSFVLSGLSPKTTYNFRVISSDVVGNNPTTSKELTFETALPPDFIPPDARITSPGGFETLTGEVLITAEVSDNYGIANVEFYIDDALKFIDDSPDYSWLWDSTSSEYPDEQYTIKIVAIDLSGNVANDEITVILDNEIIPPSIVLKRVTPNSVKAGEFTEVLFTVRISDPENRFESLKLDLSQLGGSSSQRMNDNGRNGDEEAGDQTYSFETTIDSDVIEGEKSLSITLTYRQDLTIQDTISFEVTPQNPDGGSGGVSIIELDQTIFWLFSLVMVIVVGVVLTAFVLVNKKRRSSSSDAFEVIPLD